MSSLEERLAQRRAELSANSKPPLEDRLAQRRGELEAGRKVIATTPDGGKIYELPDGSRAFASPSYSTTKPDAIERIMEGATVAQEVQRGFDEQVIRDNPVAARVQEFNQGAPLVGEWLDEGVAAAGRGLEAVGAEGIGRDLQRGAENMNVLSDAFERQRPGESIGLNVLGGAAYTAPFALAGGAERATRFINQGRGLFSKGVRAGAVAAPAATAEGASAFAGRAEPGERGQAAGLGAGVGFGLGFLLGPIATLTGEGVSQVWKRIKGMDVRSISRALDVPPSVARTIRGYMRNDDLEAAAEALRRNPNKMLAEAGPSTRQALDDAMASGAVGIGRPRVSTRVQDASGRFQDTIDSIFGTPKGLRQALREVNERTASARSAAYDRAFSQPTPTTGEAGQAIQRVLRRVDPDNMQAALRRANAAMRDDELVNLNIMATIGDNGEVTFTQPLSVQQLDYMARGLYEVADEGRNAATGQMTDAARRASNQAKALRDILKENVDGYAAAMRLGGDTIREREAIETGSKIFRNSVTLEDVQDVIRDAPDNVKTALRTGIRNNIEAAMDKARMTIQDLEAGNIDWETGANQVGEAVAAIRTMMQSGNVKKLRVALGGDATRLLREMEDMADAMTLRAAVARGSATAIRTAGRKGFEAEAQPGALRSVAGEMGAPAEALRPATRALAGTDAQTINNMTEEVARQLADALTRIGGDDARRALTVVRKAMERQPVTDAEAALLGQVLARSGFSGLRQSPKLALEPPPQP